MSWDVFVQDFPAGAERVADIPDDFRPRPLGDRASIIEHIRAAHPAANFEDASWGVLETDAFSIEFNLGEDTLVRSFAMHVRGGVEAADAVAAVLARLGVRAIDSGSGDFFSRATAREAFVRWSTYRDDVLPDAN